MAWLHVLIPLYGTSIGNCHSGNILFLTRFVRSDDANSLIDGLNAFSAELIQAASCSLGNILSLRLFRVGLDNAFFVFEAILKGYGVHQVGLGALVLLGSLNFQYRFRITAPPPVGNGSITSGFIRVAEFLGQLLRHIVVEVLAHRDAVAA